MSLNNINKLMFVMVTSCVLFEVRTEILNIILINFLLVGNKVTDKLLPLKLHFVCNRLL
jgi:hypothetical protein